MEIVDEEIKLEKLGVRIRLGWRCQFGGNINFDNFVKNSSIFGNLRIVKNFLNV